MLELDLPELEQEFRQSWRGYDVSRYESFLSRVTPANRLELLTRLLSTELDFFYQRPPVEDAPQTGDEDDDERVCPRVQLFVLRFPDLRTSPEFILRLVVLEFALRLKYDTVPPNVDSYLDLCPIHAQERMIRLLELTESKLHRTGHEQVAKLLSNTDDSTIKESDASLSITLDPLPYNLGCFLLVRMIGRGGMGYVHAAIDLRSTAQVAVKVMRRIDAWSIFRFIEEFSWLSQLNHPNLVRLYDAFSEGELRYFSMELVEGKTIRDWFRVLLAQQEAAPVDTQSTAEDAQIHWQRLRSVLRQLSSAIHFLHSQGVIHRDIKCSNVMITPRRRAVLLDLGLAIRASNSVPGQLSLDGEQLIGTLQYIAPEAISGKAFCYASDWYSFGVMMYEVLVNDYPPIRINLAATEPDERFSLDNEALNQALAWVPSDLAEVCQQLLNPNPGHRPQGQDILQRLGGGTPLGVKAFVPGEVLGRDACLAQLSEQLSKLNEGSSGLVVLRGRAGMGKTALIKTWMRSLATSEVFVLSLRCYQQDHTPLRLLNLLVQELVRRLAEQPEEQWGQAVQLFAATIAKTFPQIQQLVGGENQRSNRGELDAAKSAERRDASQQALAGLLAALSARKPMVIVVDDAQWSDHESIRTIPKLLAGRGFHGFMVLVESADSVSAVSQLPTASLQATPNFVFQTIDLEPLPKSVLRELVVQWALQSDKQLSEAIQQDLTERSCGSPFLLQELFRAFLYFASSPGYSEQEWLHTDAHENALRRFQQLSIQAENVMQYLTVADQPIGFHQLQMVSRIAPHELQRTLSYLGAQGWIRREGMQLDSEVEISHESFRDFFLGSLPPERLQRRHFRMARILSGETPPPWPRIAHHYWEAQKFREAAACYIEAARAAAKDSALEDALYFLQRAMHPEADRTASEQQQALTLKANCLAGRGSSAAAATLFQELRIEAKNPLQATMLDCLAGEQWIRAGQLDKGLALLRTALTEAGVSNWKKSVFSPWRILWRTRQALRRKVPQRIASDSAAERSFTMMERSLNRISAPLTFLDNQLGPDLILVLDELAADHGSHADHAQAAARLGILLSFGGKRWRRAAIARLHASLRMTRETNLTSARAAVYMCMFVWYAQRGYSRRAIHYGQRAISFYESEKQSSRWEIEFLHWGILACYWERCHLLELHELTRRYRESARDRSDPMSLFWMHVNATITSDLSLDQIEAARAATEIASQAIADQRFQSPRFFLWLSRIQVATYAGNWSIAQQELRADWKNLSDSLVLGTNHYLWLALTARLCADLVSYRNDPQNSGWLRDAKWTVRRMLRLEERIFVLHGRAAELVLHAALGRIAPQHQWQHLVGQLHAVGHHLTAIALQWHQSLYAEAALGESMQKQAEQWLRDEAVVDPRRLLDIVLPLPTHPDFDHS